MKWLTDWIAWTECSVIMVVEESAVNVQNSSPTRSLSSHGPLSRCTLA